MPIGGGPAIDRPAELSAADIRRPQRKQLGSTFCSFFVDLAGSVHVDEQRHRIGDPDRIGDLDGAALGEPGGDHVLGEVARRIGGRAVDLGRVLAGERAPLPCGA